MNKRFHTSWGGMTVTAAVWAAVGCQSHGAGDETPGNPSHDPPDGIVALELPTNMSVVSVRTEGQALIHDVTAFAGVSDYHQDRVGEHMYDPSMRPLDTVNLILCLLEQTRASAQLNVGPYIALVDMDRCDTHRKQGGGAGAGSVAPEFTEWTVDARRARNDAPMTVKIWLRDKDGPNDQAQNILIDIIATDGVGPGRPFGAFSMHFEGVTDIGETIMRGSLVTVDNPDGKPQFRFINTMGAAANPSISGYAQIEATNAVLDDAAGSTGTAKTFSSYESGSHRGAETYALAFDRMYLLRGKDVDQDNTTDEAVCASRNDLESHVWQYNLYHRDAGTIAGRSVSSGSRVSMQSGFPFRYDDGTRTHRGYMSYWGPWLDSDQPLPDRAQIIRTRRDGGEAGASTYTIRHSGGKLIRLTENTLSMERLAGESFFYFGENPANGQHGEWRVQVQNAAFVISDRVEFTDQGPVFTPLDGPVSIMPQYEGETLWMWSDTLGGDVRYQHTERVADRAVQFFAQETVGASDPVFAAPFTLQCQDNCLRGGVREASNHDDLFYPYGDTQLYTLSQADGVITLIDEGNGRAVDFSRLDLRAVGYDGGMQTGSLYPATGQNGAVAYRWESGPNPWNRYVAAIDERGEAAVFSRPLALAYNHETAHDRNDDDRYDGRTFMLQYGGSGELSGFPRRDGDEVRGYAGFALRDGVVLSVDLDRDGREEHLVVKATDIEYTMRETRLSTCSSANLDIDAVFSSLPLPTARDIRAVSFTLGEKPAVTDPPAVIDGEIQ